MLHYRTEHSQLLWSDEPESRYFPFSYGSGSQDARRIITTIGSTAGLFFIEDAAQAADDQGRKVIRAQDFVSAYGVKSVFGTGGAYRGGQMLVFVVFCRDPVARDTAELFLPLVDLFRSKTASLAAPATVFGSA